MTVIDGFSPFVGQHCETTTTGNLLKAAGLELSEPMLFGLGGGLSYGVFVIKAMGMPFIGGRPRLEQITKSLADNLGFRVDYRQTRSAKRAWTNVSEFIDAGQPVGVKLNSRFLDYFTSNVNFGGHYVAMYGYDSETVSVVDTAQQGGAQVTNRQRFEDGRLWKGSMASNAMTWTVTVESTDIDWTAVILKAISANAHTYLRPPIKNFGAKGISKTARLITDWYDNYDTEALAQLGVAIDGWGTGGGLFRPMYAHFLKEAHEHLNQSELLDIADRIDEAGAIWTQISACLTACVSNGRTSLETASEMLDTVAEIEQTAVTRLAMLELDCR